MTRPARPTPPDTDPPPADAGGESPTPAAAGPAPTAVGPAPAAAGPAPASTSPAPDRIASLAERQAALVDALVAGAPVPPGFDARLVGIARTALLRKRAGEVARHWPMLAASFGSAWPKTFAEWADGRPSNGSLRDGWDFALARGPLAGPPADELREKAATWHYVGDAAPRRRSRPVAAVRLWWARR